MSNNYKSVQSLCERITAPLNEIIKATSISVNSRISNQIVECLSNSLQKPLNQISDSIKVNLEVALQPLVEYYNSSIKELADIQEENLSALCKSLAESIDNSNTKQEFADIYNSIPENVTFEFTDDNVELLAHIDPDLRAANTTTLNKNTIISIMALLIAAATLFWTIKSSIQSTEKADEGIAKLQEIDESCQQTNELLRSISYQLDQASSESDQASSASD